MLEYVYKEFMSGFLNRLSFKIKKGIKDHFMTRSYSLTVFRGLEFCKIFLNGACSYANIYLGIAFGIEIFRAGCLGIQNF